MEDNAKLIESLLEKAADYGKTSLDLIKLKALDKSTDAASTFIPHFFVFALIAIFLIFLNLGVAFWLGEILGNIYFGFFVVAGFYGIVGIVLHFFLHKWIKRIICNFLIRNVLK